VSQIATFIAGLSPDIPYSLLGFYPHFFMPDLPRTSRNHAETCLQAALDAGLKKVRIGNIHLLGNDY
jgi:pyruvate formate lyase activating enzyme